MIICLVYFVAVGILAIYGFHRSLLLQSSRNYFIENKTEVDNSKKVCIQVPLYNENRVAKRIIDSVAKINYPNLEIQILDDSNDKTIEIVDDSVSFWKNNNINIKVIRRENRKGFKAGALAYGLTKTDADYVAIFDADFIPEKDFLAKTLPYFEDQKVAFIQTRWGHLNRNLNLLTKAQAILIDGHFVIEHAARFLKGFFNFNGTAGVWRISAINEAGGWQGDTITEDLDLSYRAKLKGYKSIFLRDVVCMSELPETLSAFKSQQYRWMKGSAQVFKKLAKRIFFSNLKLSEKTEALFHLSGNFCYILMLLTIILLVPVSLYRLNYNFSVSPIFELFLFFFTLVSLVLFYISSQKQQKLKVNYLEILSAVILGIGMGAHCAFASLSGLFGEVGEFIRTPKTGTTNSSKKRSIPRFSAIWKLHLKELFVLIYLFCGLAIVIFNKGYLTTPFIALIIAGYLMILILGTNLEKKV